MKEFSHIGIPTSVARYGETYLEGAKLYVTDFNASPNKILEAAGIEVVPGVVA